MEADFSVEMGAEDAVLEVPWAAPDASLQFFDLVAHPELIEGIAEARRFPELAEFLRGVNVTNGVFATVKCDAWASSELDPSEEIFDATHKQGSYCDLIFRRPELQRSFEAYDSLSRRVTARLRTVPDIAAAAEMVVRRCYYQSQPEMAEGFALTVFVTGYGNHAAQARQNWGSALELVKTALVQATLPG
jgi:hypothetical protein